MEIFAMAVAMVTELTKLRAMYFAAMSPEKQRELADRGADNELRVLDFLESLRPKP